MSLSVSPLELVVFGLTHWFSLSHLEGLTLNPAVEISRVPLMEIETRIGFSPFLSETGER